MSFETFLKRFPAINLVLATASAGLSKTIFQQSMVPANLNWLGGAGALVAITAFLCVWARIIENLHKAWLVALAGLSLVVLISMRVQLVESFEFYGETFNELRGWKLAPFGATVKANLESQLGSTLSLHDVIYYYDHTQIAQLFGENWYVSAFLYSGSFLVFLFCVVSLAGRFELDSIKSRDHERHLP